MRLQYPGTIRIIRVPCTGKVDLIHLLRPFEKGADGVCVFGCMEGNCHFDNGNIRARTRLEQARDILERVGVGGERVRMYNLSAAEGPLFARYASDITKAVLEMGPNPVKAAIKGGRNP